MNKTFQNNTNSFAIRRAIMRRVWYAYGLSVVLSKSMFCGLTFGASVIGFWRLVSITSIINNLLHVQVGEVPQYIMYSLMQAEILALLTFGIIVFTILSVGVRLTFSPHSRQLATA